MSRNLETLGASVRQHVDTSLSQNQRVRLRAQLVHAAQRRPRPSYGKLGVLAAPLALAALVAVWFVLHNDALTFEIATPAGLGEQPGDLGAVYDVEGRDQRSLRFSDGSVVHLDQAGALRVVDAKQAGATVQLIDGRATAEVVPQADNSWRFLAGPYTVQVTGTAFELSWKPARSEIEVVMRHGSVRILGPRLGDGIELKDQERFRAIAPSSDQESESEMVQLGSANEVPGNPGTVNAPTESTKTASPKSKLAPRDRTTPLFTTPLSDLARRGQYQTVLTLAAERGLEQVLERGSLEEVAAVADSARYVGKAEVAKEALLALRSRFTNTARARSAAFLLGRMLDASNPAAALGWYETYLSETPAGPLASEALGRKMLVIHRQRGADAAAIIAREYLARFADGSHARHARELVAAADTEPSP